MDWSILTSLVDTPFPLNLEIMQAGFGTEFLLRSERIVPLRSFKARNVLLHSFFRVFGDL